MYQQLDVIAGGPRHTAGMSPIEPGRAISALTGRQQPAIPTHPLAP